MHKRAYVLYILFALLYMRATTRTWFSLHPCYTYNTKPPPVSGLLLSWALITRAKHHLHRTPQFTPPPSPPLCSLRDVHVADGGDFVTGNLRPKFDRYFSRDKKMLGWDRTVGNMAEQSVPFLALFWLSIVLSDRGGMPLVYVVSAGWLYIALRSFYPVCCCVRIYPVRCYEVVFVALGNFAEFS